MTQLLMLWSEWDIDERFKIFANKEAGLKWLSENLIIIDIAKEEGLAVEMAIPQFFDDGLLAWRTVELIK